MKSSSTRRRLSANFDVARLPLRINLRLSPALLLLLLSSAAVPRAEAQAQSQMPTQKQPAKPPAAGALDCHFVYALVPRSSLEKTMHTQAVELATRDVGPATGAENAGLHAARIEHVAARLVAGSPLWSDAPGN